MTARPHVRPAQGDEAERLGQLLVKVYAALPGFPPPDEQPAYYELLAQVGRFADTPAAEVLVAVARHGGLMGGVVYFGDMAHYRPGSLTDGEAMASGIRLLGVDARHQGAGVGKALTLACLDRARARGHRQVILHTTRAMQTAWGMYERLGFVRAPQFDFGQGELAVFGFTLDLAA